MIYKIKKEGKERKPKTNNRTSLKRKEKEKPTKKKTHGRNQLDMVSDSAMWWWDNNTWKKKKNLVGTEHVIKCMYVLATDLPLLSHFGEYMRATLEEQAIIVKRKRKRKVMKHI
jgi:hypothetical protein